jgi:catechol 2,3-dioxygenase-like lactoylglutathione lyase family enzyme
VTEDARNAAVRYLVDDLRAATAFYIDQLGFTEKANWGPIVILERGDLELWLSGPGTSAAKHSVVGNRIVLHVDDLNQALADLGSSAEIVDGRAGRWAVVGDPTGNLVELFETPDPSG